MTRGTLDSAGLTAAYLQRIDALDRQGQGPALHAIIQRNPHALDEAQQLDAERRAGHLRGSLHGIPLVLKDNIDARPMANSAGSLAVADFHPPHDAILVQRLRQARAVILGKSNLSEWANFHSSKSSSGWSARSEQTRHPYVLDRNPCGSSAGTGVAVSANLAAAGIGTGTDGSIVCPAAVNGLVGLKPTVGLISRDGIIPISASQDSAGPTTRSVADAATVLSVLAARDTADPAAAAAPRPSGRLPHTPARRAHRPAALAADAEPGHRRGAGARCRTVKRVTPQRRQGATHQQTTGEVNLCRSNCLQPRRAQW